MVEKMIKKDHKSHPGVIYAESMLYAVAIKAIYYGINMKGRLYPMKPKVVKAPFFNNKIKQSMER